MTEKQMYLSNNIFVQMYKIISKHPDYIFYKAIIIHKKYRQAKEQNKHLLTLIYSMKANRISSKYNLELYGKYGENLRIWHGNIILNGNCIIGNNVNLLGNNCIGTKKGKAPVIGNNVNVGFGSVIVGDVIIADNITIGANSFVNKNFREEGVVIAGCPAKIIGKK